MKVFMNNASCLWHNKDKINPPCAQTPGRFSDSFHIYNLVIGRLGQLDIQLMRFAHAPGSRWAVNAPCIMSK